MSPYLTLDSEGCLLKKTIFDKRLLLWTFFPPASLVNAQIWLKFL